MFKRLEKKEEKSGIWFSNCYLNQKNGNLEFRYNGETHVANKNTLFIYLCHRSAIQVYKNSAYIVSVQGIDKNYAELEQEPKKEKGMALIAFMKHVEKTGRIIETLVKINIFGAKGDYMYKMLCNSYLGMRTFKNDKGEDVEEMMCSYVQVGRDNHIGNKTTSKKEGYSYFNKKLYKDFIIGIENESDCTGNTGLIQSIARLVMDKISEYYTLFAQWDSE
jgi:hypothetical protein